MLFFTCLALTCLIKETKKDKYSKNITINPMKKLITMLALSAITTGAFAQGQTTWSNCYRTALRQIRWRVRLLRPALPPLREELVRLVLRPMDSTIRSCLTPPVFPPITTPIQPAGLKWRLGGVPVIGTNFITGVAGEYAGAERFGQFASR